MVLLKTGTGIFKKYQQKWQHLRQVTCQVKNK
jgi:hypothetical protein